jgi:carboxyl-terminal processing protease
MKQLLRRLWIPSLILLALTLGLVAGVGLDRGVLTASAAPGTDPADTGPDFQLIREAWNTIQHSYVDRVAAQPRQMTYGAISGMVDALGDTGHSHFLTPDMVQHEHDFTEGHFEGIGAEVQMKDGHVVIVAPMDDSPAQQAGVHPGDIILKVNGQDVLDLPLFQVVQRIQGPAGSQVTLTLMDAQTEQTRDVSLQRARITLHNVTWQVVPGTKIAHIRIAAFSQGVTQALKQALSDAQRQGASGVILDLRNDPGGLLGEAVGVASQFLPQGNVLLEKDAQGKVIAVPVKPDGQATAMPAVVLINAGTASAAEIVAGALQDAGRARLLGETSFGTGTVLDEFHLSDGSSLLLATQEWLTPKGRVIWHQGIAPDVAVALPQNATPLLPKAERGMTAAGVRGSQDEQLLKALDVLR